MRVGATTPGPKTRDICGAHRPRVSRQDLFRQVRTVQSRVRRSAAALQTHAGLSENGASVGLSSMPPCTLTEEPKGINALGSSARVSNAEVEEPDHALLTM